MLDREFAKNQNDLFLLCRTVRRRRPHRRGARHPRRRRHAAPDDVKIIYRQHGPASRGNHFGGRIVHSNTGYLFISNGEHFSDRDMAQTLDNDLGKIVRIAPDGTPADGQSIFRASRRAAGNLVLWSSQPARPRHEPGRRHIVGAGTRRRWAATKSMSSRRARITAGRMSAMASITMAAKSAPARRQRPALTDPVWHWTPSIAPSGMTFYTGDLFPGWKGSLFNGALKFQLLSRLEIKDGRS